MSRTSALVLATRLAGAALALAVTPTVSPARQAAPPAIDWMSRLAPGALPTTTERPFGTLREQAAMQQAWLARRLDTFLPPLMRKHGIDTMSADTYRRYIERSEHVTKRR